MATAPTPIPAGPAVPNSALPEPTFDAQYEAFNQWERDELAPKANALAQNVYENTSEVVSNAASAASSASIATAQADAAMGYRNTAQAAATTATSKAAEADASAIAASKLNLGDKATPPTTDNQGGALRAGATYYDTALNKWRVWTGAAWGDGISAVAGVSSIDGQTGAVTGVVRTDLHANYDSTASMADAPLGRWVSYLANGAAGTDWPETGITLAWWNVFTFGSSSRRTQIAHQAFVGSASPMAMYVRGMHDSTWGAWRRVAVHNEPPVAISSGVMNCALGNHFTAAVSGNTTLSFTNIPAGAFACVLEVNRTAGTITFPSGTVWSGTAPTLGVGRHLFFFQRAQLGTAGWYVSALTGYSA